MSTILNPSHMALYTIRVEDIDLPEACLVIEMPAELGQLLEEILTRNIEDTMSWLAYFSEKLAFQLPDGEKTPWGIFDPGEIIRWDRYAGDTRYAYTFPLPEACEPVDEDDHLWVDRWGATKLSLMLHIFFDGLQMACACYDGAAIEDKLQLVEIDLVSYTGEQHGCGVTGTISPELVSFFFSADNDFRNDCNRALHSLADHIGMTGGLRAKKQQAEIRALIGPPRGFMFQCLGNAADIALHQSADPTMNRGCRLEPHNVDSPEQQLVLLYALVYACQLARAQIEPK